MSKIDSILTVYDLTKHFGATPAVDGVSLQVDAGEIVCLLGPSGCGKTTLLRLIAGLEVADRGDVVFDGRNMNGIPPHEREFGMMFQDFALFPHKNVFDNVAFGLRMRQRAPGEIAVRVAEMLALVDLTGFEQRTVDQLSGGEQQRVALARSLAVQPRLLLLDEPLGALDRALRERLMLDLRQILKRVGVTTISVTHDQTEAFAIADRIVVMNSGRIEQTDRPEILFESPRTPFVARFLGYHNLLPGRVVTNRVETALGSLLLPVDGRPEGTAVTVLIKPDALQNGANPAGFAIEGEVTAISFRGRFYQVWLTSAGLSLMFEQNEPPDLAVGESGRWGLDPGACLIMADSARAGQAG